MKMRGTHQSSVSVPISQNHTRAEVAQQMVDEMLRCDIDQFLSHYAPFVPSECSVDMALKKLKGEKLSKDDRWQGLHGENLPSKTQDIDTVVSSKLTRIVEALENQECDGVDSNTSRERNFRYNDCGDMSMAGEIAGCTFLIDACFSPISSPLLSGPVMASQVAVAAEYRRKMEDFYDVSTRILNIAVSLI